MMHRRASQQTAQAQAQAQGSPYPANGSMPPPATHNFAGSPQQQQHQFDRPSSQASQHGGYAMSRSGSGSDPFAATHGATPGPNSTPRVPGGVLPSGSPVASTAGAGKAATKTKAAAKKPKASAAANKKTPKSAGVPEPPSPIPQRPESSASHHTHHESPYPAQSHSQPQSQGGPLEQSTYSAMTQPSPQQVLQQHEDMHHPPTGHPSLTDFEFDLDPGTMSFPGLEGLEGMDAFVYDTGEAGAGGAEDEFDFSNWMVDAEA